MGSLLNPILSWVGVTYSKIRKINKMSEFSDSKEWMTGLLYKWSQSLIVKSQVVCRKSYTVTITNVFFSEISDTMSQKY